MGCYDEGSKETTYGLSEEIVRLREYEQNDRTVLYLRDCPNAKAKIDDAFLSFLLSVFFVVFLGGDKT